MSGPIDHLMPSDPLMAGAWIGAVHWALGEPEVIEQFRAETGNQWRPGAAGLSRLIDEATGADRAFLVEFCTWFNGAVWGNDPDAASEGRPA